MLKVKPPSGKKIFTEVYLSGSKSLSNRLLMIRAISGLPIHYKNLSDSDDTITLAKELGAIEGKDHATIDVGHAGTDMRFLTAYLSCKKGDWVLTGSDRMKKRPIGELVNALRKLGAEISYVNEEGYPPLKIKGKKLNGGELDIDGGISSQFITALLLIAPLFDSGLKINLKNEVVSKPYIKMTIDVMRHFDIKVSYENQTINILPSTYKKDGIDYHVESDWSSASYWYALAALAKEADIKLFHFNKPSLQSDSVIADIFLKLGVVTEWSATGIRLTKSNSEAKEFEYNCIDCPDIAQTIAAVCTAKGIKVKLTGLQTLKLKETDRIEAMKNELQKFGAKIEITANSIDIFPPENVIKPLEPIQTYHDHRMAMSIVPLSLISGELTVIDPDVVNKSYAAFWDDLQEAGFEIE